MILFKILQEFLAPSVKNIIKANLERYRAWRINSLKINPLKISKGLDKLFGGIKI